MKPSPDDRIPRLPARWRKLPAPFLAVLARIWRQVHANCPLSDPTPPAVLPIPNALRVGLGVLAEAASAIAMAQSWSCAAVMAPHLFGMVLLTPPILALSGQRWAESRALAYWFVLATNACLPVLGPAISTVFMLIDRSLRPAPSQSQFAVGDSLEQTDQSAMDLAPVSQSIVAILNSRAVRARRSAILALRAFNDAAAVHVLRRAIRDSDEQVRSYANSRLKRLIDGMEAAIKELETRLMLDPHNYFIQLALAEQLFEMVEMGLVNPENEDRVLHRVADLLLTGRREEHFPEAELLALKCNLRLGFGDNAQACLERLVEMKYRSELLEPYRFEVLFEQRDWEMFGAELKSATSTHPSPQIKQLADFWLAPGDSPA